MWAKQLLEKEVMGIVPRLLSRSQEEGHDSTLAETASLGAVFVQRGWRKKNGAKRLPDSSNSTGLGHRALRLSVYIMFNEKKEGHGVIERFRLLLERGLRD